MEIDLHGQSTKERKKLILTAFIRIKPDILVFCYKFDPQFITRRATRGIQKTKHYESVHENSLSRFGIHCSRKRFLLDNADLFTEIREKVLAKAGVAVNTATGEVEAVAEAEEE